MRIWIRKRNEFEFEFRKSWIALGDLAMIDGDATIYTLAQLNSIRSVGLQATFSTALPPHVCLAYCTSHANQFHITPPG